MYFVGNLIFGPIFDWAGKYFAGNPPVAGLDMGEISYIPSAIFGIMLALEIVFIISFAAVIARRETVGNYIDY